MVLYFAFRYNQSPGIALELLDLFASQKATFRKGAWYLKS